MKCNMDLIKFMHDMTLNFLVYIARYTGCTKFVSPYWHPNHYKRTDALDEALLQLCIFFGFIPWIMKRFKLSSLNHKYKLSKAMRKTHFHALRKTMYGFKEQTLTSSSKGIGVLDPWCFADTELLESDLLPEPFARCRCSAATSRVFWDSFPFWPVNRITIQFPNFFLKILHTKVYSCINVKSNTWRKKWDRDISMVVTKSWILFLIYCLKSLNTRCYK